MDFDIKFINHACFQIVKEEYSILCDPWFEGKVFNDSWSLLKNTKVEDLDLSKLKYIFISHEHPDHLNWGSLKKIREVCSQKILVIMPERRNSNVHKNLIKIGFNSLQVPANQEYSIEDNVKFSFFKKNHDAAIVFDVDNTVIFNKNDCEFSAEELVLIKNNLSKQIDILFNQFSLAGYYGNRDDNIKLQNAKDRHISDLIETAKILEPKITVPFASFITFCRNENQYLNKYIVSLEEIVAKSQNLNIYVPYYLENILFRKNKFEIEKITKKNCKQWSQIFKKNIKKDTHKTPKIESKHLKESYDIMYKELTELRSYSSLKLPDDTFTVFIQDINRYCKFSFLNSLMYMSDNKEKPDSIVATVSSYDLNGFFKNPWGADTLNITSCFTAHDVEKWKKMLLVRDVCYVR